MSYPKIIRNRYRVGETDNRQHASAHHEEDMRDFHLPLAALHQRYLHTWGICSGLEVSGALGSGEVTVQPGVAIDAEGHMIVVADEGLAQIQEGNLVTIPVILTLSELPAGQYYVTLTYAENEQPEPGDTTGRTRPINVRQAPFVRLEAATTFVDNGVTLILGVVTIDEAHHLAALSTLSQLGGGRRLAGQAVMTLEVRRPRQQVNDQEPTQVLTEAMAGALAPWPSGGLHLTVADDADQIAFSAQSGNNFAALQIRANETRLQGDLAVQGVLTLHSTNNAPALRVSIDADSAHLITTDHALTLATASSARLTIKPNGNVGIGTVDPQYTLDVNGRLNVRELYVNGAALATLLPAPSQWTTLADAGGIAYTSGNVGIGTTSPTQRLDVNGAVKAQNFLIGTKPIVSSQWNNGTSGINYTSGHVGIDTDNPTAPLHVATYMAVGPFSPTHGTGGIDVTGPVAELGFVRRDLTAWPATTKPGDRFVWYNPDGTARLWTNNMGDLLTTSATGNVGIGTTAPNARLTVDDPSGDTTWNTAAFHKASLGPWWSHIHWGATGDWYIRSASSEGTVYLQDNGGYVRIGGNRTGIFMALNDDLWFSDPQNGTIQIRNGNNSDFGQMIGHFRPPSSIEYKADVVPLHYKELDQLLTDTLNTTIFHFRYKGDDVETRLRLGVIAEKSPAYILGDDGKSLSTAEYLAMLHGAIKSLAQQVAYLTHQQPKPLVNDYSNDKRTKL